MAKKIKKAIKLYGELYMNPSGDVYFLYGGWHKVPVGNIKGTKVYDSIVETYGTKKGIAVRKTAAYSIVKSVKVGKIAGK